MEIIMADPTGICFGVERALKAAEEAVDVNNSEDPTSNIYSFGSLIHNKQVTDSLEKRGLKIIDSLDEAEAGSTVILRCHGVPAEVYDHAKERGLKIIDTIREVADELVMYDEIGLIVNRAPLPERVRRPSLSTVQETPDPQLPEATVSDTANP